MEYMLVHTYAFDRRDETTHTQALGSLGRREKRTAGQDAH